MLQVQHAVLEWEEPESQPCPARGCEPGWAPHEADGEVEQTKDATLAPDFEVGSVSAVQHLHFGEEDCGQVSFADV